jgi:hypothetical protein
MLMNFIVRQFGTKSAQCNLYLEPGNIIHDFLETEGLPTDVGRFIDVIGEVLKY